MNISLTQILIIINTCMYLQYDLFSIFLKKYALFSPSLISNFADVPRLIVPHFSHINFFHLVINMLSLSRTGLIMEHMLGDHFLTITFLLGILSSIFHILLSYVSCYIYNNQATFYTKSMGFSCILFALKYIYLNRLNRTINMFGYDINSKYAIWYDLAIAQILIPNASFIGHLSGIFAGILVNEIILI